MKKRRVYHIIRITIALVVFIWVLRKVQYETILQSLQNPERPVLLIIGALMLLPNLLLQWYRWYYLLRLIEPDISKYEALISLLGGTTIGLITPARLGEFSRSLFLKNTNHTQAMGMIFIDKFYSSIIFIIVGFWGLFILMGHRYEFNLFMATPMVGIGLLISIVGIMLLLRPRYFRTLCYNLTLLLPFRDRMKKFIAALEYFKKTHAFRYFILSFILFAIFITQFCLFAMAFERINVLFAISATTSTMFTKMLLPISIGDLGIREGAAIFFFMQYGVRKTTAFNSSFLLFFINVIIPPVMGLFYLPRLGRQEKKPA